MGDRPVVHAIVAWRLPNGQYIVRKGEPVTLAVAADFARVGWEVFPDPWELDALTRWEQLQRAVKPKWQKW